MEPSKVEIFERERPGQPLPTLVRLGDAEAKRIRDALARKAGLDQNLEPLAFATALASLSRPVQGVNADDPDFDLASAFALVGITPGKYVYLDWYRFERIDLIAYAELSDHFDYIWYAGPDDIDLFDASLSWVVSVWHDGYLSFVDLSKAS